MPSDQAIAAPCRLRRECWQHASRCLGWRSRNPRRRCLKTCGGLLKKFSLHLKKTTGAQRPLRCSLLSLDRNALQQRMDKHRGASRGEQGPKTGVSLYVSPGAANTSAKAVSPSPGAATISAAAMFSNLGGGGHPARALPPSHGPLKTAAVAAMRAPARQTRPRPCAVWRGKGGVASCAGLMGLGMVTAKLKLE